MGLINSLWQGNGTMDRAGRTVSRQAPSNDVVNSVEEFDSCSKVSIEINFMVVCTFGRYLWFRRDRTSLQES